MNKQAASARQTVIGNVKAAALAVTSLVALSGLFGCSQASSDSGFIDKTGQLVINVDKMAKKPVAVSDFSEELAELKLEKGWACLNKTGSIVFELDCDEMKPFSEGLAAFCRGQGANARWGYVNKQGVEVIKPTFADAKPFSMGVAAVKNTVDATNGKDAERWVYIGAEGQKLIPDSYEDAEPFAGGLASVTQGKRVGAINMSGKMVIPANYDVIYPAADNVVVAAINTGESGETPDQTLDFYTVDGSKTFQRKFDGVTLTNLKPPKWALTKDKGEDLVRPLSKYQSPGSHCGKTIGQTSGKFAINEQFSARAFAGSYDYIFPVSEEYFVVYQDKDGGKMDYRGGKPESAAGIWNSTAFRFYDAAPFSDGLGLVQETKGGLYGYIDKTAQFAIKPQFKYARPFHDGLALVGALAKN